MIGIDTNLLVCAHRRDMPFHERASALVRGKAEGNAEWALPWPCVHEFYAVVTNPKIFRDPSPPETACRQVETWLASPTVVLLAEDAGYWTTLAVLLRRSGVVGPRVHDARIAALCLHHDVRELWTADRDFGRFPALRARNPLLEDPPAD